MVTVDATGESNEKMGEPVPATPPTLTADSPNIVRIELLRQAIVVADVQDDVSHATISSALVAVSSPTPKSSPETVTELPPLTAVFNATEETRAVSKLKMRDDVPAIAATVTADSPNIVLNAPETQEVDVAEVQDVEPHGTNSRAAVDVTSLTPKSSPTTVTDAPPLAGVFHIRRQLDATGESKLYPSTSVPATPPTLTVDTNTSVTTARDKQPKLVADVQDDVLQTASDSAALALSSETPKSSPITVTELPPLTAEFRSPYDTTAASKLYPSTSVPATPPTLTVDTNTFVTAARDKQPKLVADDQDDVLQTASDSAALALSSEAPKSSPITVTELPPLNALFSRP